LQGAAIAIIASFAMPWLAAALFSIIIGYGCLIRTFSPIGIKVIKGCPRTGTHKDFRGERQPNPWLFSSPPA